MYSLLRVLPKNYLSYLIGQLSEIRPPRFAAPLVSQIAARILNLNTAEAEQPIGSYRSVQELFTRRLKPGSRPIAAGLVSPVDGVLRTSGEIDQGCALLVKGSRYSLAQLVGAEFAEKFPGGSFFNFYLRPSDYHRVHAPCDMRVLARLYVPGKLWPVNTWALSNIESLFAVNERICVLFESAFGLGALIMVGAFNVGKMTLSFDDLMTNKPCRSRDVSALFRQFTPAIGLKAGDEFGVFQLGSSVVLLFSTPGLSVQGKGLEGGELRVGQKLQ